MRNSCSFKRHFDKILFCIFNALADSIRNFARFTESEAYRALAVADYYESGEFVRAVVETVGIKDIRTKALRSNNPCNVVRATLNGLSLLRTADEVAAVRGKSVKEIIG